MSNPNNPVLTILETIACMFETIGLVIDKDLLVKKNQELGEALENNASADVIKQLTTDLTAGINAMSGQPFIFPYGKKVYFSQPVHDFMVGVSTLLRKEEMVLALPKYIPQLMVINTEAVKPLERAPIKSYSRISITEDMKGQIFSMLDIFFQTHPTLKYITHDAYIKICKRVGLPNTQVYQNKIRSIYKEMKHAVKAAS